MTTSQLTCTIPPHYALTSCRAIDGDAIEALVMLPLGVAVRTRIRLRGFFAPELNGSQPAAAVMAKERLQAALDSHQCHILSRGSREDRYGRLAAYLLLDGRAADPNAILGPCQLSEADHDRDLKHSRRVTP